MSDNSSNTKALKSQINKLKRDLHSKDKEILALFNANILLDERIAELENENQSIALVASKIINNDEKYQEISKSKIDRQQLMQILGGTKRLNVTLCLQLVRDLLPERIDVAETAWVSAEEHDDVFSKCNELLNLLARLSVDYFEQVQKGEEGKFFTTSEFAGAESQTTTNNRELSAERVFYYKGRRIPMSRHLKIGNSLDSSKTLRLYYQWSASDGKIIIGYCGKHLSLLDKR